MNELLSFFSAGCQAQDCSYYYPARLRISCLADGRVVESCPKGFKQDHEIVQGEIPQCFCWRLWTPEETVIKDACACESYLSQCLSGPGYEFSCGFAAFKCTRDVLSKVCNNITDKSSDTFDNLCETPLLSQICKGFVPECRGFLGFSNDNCQVKYDQICTGHGSIEDYKVLFKTARDDLQNYAVTIGAQLKAVEKNVSLFNKVNFPLTYKLISKLLS